jgi:hypothetical protein
MPISRYGCPTDGRAHRQLRRYLAGTAGRIACSILHPAAHLRYLVGLGSLWLSM